MSAGVLPDAMSEDDRVAARSYLQSAIQEPYASVRSLPIANLRSFVDAQRQQFSTPAQPDNVTNSHDQEWEEQPPRVRASHNEPAADAHFIPSDKWRRPSDYVAHLTHAFESEWINH